MSNPLTTPVNNFNAPLLTIDETQDLVDQTINSVYDAVVSTMGPNGKYAFISMGGGVKVTKDGVTVAKSIQFDDPRQETINRVLTEPAIKTDDECGDGTTTTILLAVELVRLFKAHNSFFKHRILEEVIYLIIDQLIKDSIRVTADDYRLLEMAITSANSDVKLAEQVVALYQNSTGRFPEIELKEGGGQDRVVVTDGMGVQMYYANPVFSLQGNGSESTFRNFIPVVIDGKLGKDQETPGQIDNLIKSFKDRGDTSVTLVLIARSIDNDLCSLISQANMGNKNVRIIGINLLSGGSMASLILQDIATMLGCEVGTSIEQALSLKNEVSPVALTVGMSRSVVSEFPDSYRSILNDRADAIEKELAAYEYSDRFSVRAKLNRMRVQKLRGELITIFVGGETNSDIKERLDRFEDVVKAVKSALTHGILPGVGTSLIISARKAVQSYLSDAIEQEDMTATHLAELNILCLALVEVMKKPYIYLMTQVLGDSDKVKIGEQLETYDLATGRKVSPEMAGIYDTAYATITALRGGVQTAKSLAKVSSIHLGSKLSAVKMR